MRSIATMMVLAAGAVSCGATPAPKALPTDLLPPEYEKPRGYDLPGAKGAEAGPPGEGAKPQAPPSAAPSSTPAAPAAPAPPSAPASPTPPR